jgi:hypothetical protein
LAVSTGDKSTPRHCASTRLRAETFFGGGIGKFWTENLELKTENFA